MADLAGQTAVVTGATSGIGRSVALALGRKGVNLHLIGRDSKRNASLLAEVREMAPTIEARAWTMDLSKTILGPVARMTKRDFSVDILVHSAGSIMLNSFASTTEAELDLQYQVNLKAPFVLTQLLLPHLRTRQGQIVFVNSSVSNQRASANFAAYAASKYALTAVTDSLRDEVNRDGVRVLSVYPGRTATPMQQEIFRFENRAYHAEQLLQPEDVAETIVASLSLPRTAEVTDIQVRPMKNASGRSQV